MTNQNQNFDFKAIAEQLRPHINSIVFDLCPGGEIKGNEYVAASILGGKGTSFRINLTSGKWADFADANQRGHDIISYYAKCKNLNNGQAAKELKQIYLGEQPRPKLNYPVEVKKDKAALIKPPPNAAPPQQIHLGLLPAYTWCYRDGQGDPWFYIYRYNLPDGSKEFRPLCYDESGKWVLKAWPQPRPLYNLDLILKFPDKPILVCEGEKAADAAAKITSAYITTTWPNGAQSVNKAAWDTLYNRKVLLWPDADEAGIKCMAHLGQVLAEFCQEVKVIETDRTDGWDAADALSEGMNHQALVDWAKPLVRTITKPMTYSNVEVLDPEPAKQSNPNDQAAETEVKVSRNLTLMYIEAGLKMNEKTGKVAISSDNITKILCYMDEFKNHLWFDTFHHRVFMDWNGERRPLNDISWLQITARLQGFYELTTLKKDTVWDAIQIAAHQNPRNEVKEYITSHTWDQTPRVQTFFQDAMGAEDSEYARAVSRNFFISIVARVMNPGCKVDTMVILEGGQGTFKSTSLKILAGDWFAEANSSLDSKDFEQGLVGRMIVEFGELDQFRKSDSTLIKKKLSCSVDTYRPSYGRSVVDIPRMCVFVGTTNKDKYLQDETGGRRFWPIRVKVCDIEYIKANRDQLFAEALWLYNQGCTWHEVPEEAKAEQEARREQDPYEEYILEWLNGVFDPTKPWLGTQKKERFTTKDVWESALRGDPSRLDIKAQKSISKSLKSLGYEQVVSKDSERRTIRLWVKTLGSEKIDNS